MTIKQAKQLKVGDRVQWVNGGNGCPADTGTVELDEQYPFVRWDDPKHGERTYLVDTPALKSMETV
jgi:hypothetical protein